MRPFVVLVSLAGLLVAAARGSEVRLTPCESNVVLPQGSTITKFTLFANDADADINSTAYLMRKRIVNNLNPAKSGIVTMAQASTAGAVTDTLRAFSTTAITGPTVANGANQYFVELVNCGKTVEPFSVQITTSVP